MEGIHVVWDANGTAYRADMTTQLYTHQGERTSAIIGVLNIAHSTLEELSETYQLPIKDSIFAWDMGHSPRRKSIFPQYKSNRKKEWTPEDQQWKEEFFHQTDVLHENLHLFGMKSFRKRQWEGDDLILGFTEEITRRYPNDISVIVSTDEDFHQLISPTVHVFSPIKKILYTPTNYKQLAGIDVSNFLAYKILKGDSSDGIPGINGIGEKTAKAIVNKYGNLAGVLENSTELGKSKSTAAIFTREGLSILDSNNKLINLKDYVDLSPVKQEIKDILSLPPSMDHKAARAFLMQYQLTSIIVKYKEWSVVFEDIGLNFD